MTRTKQDTPATQQDHHQQRSKYQDVRGLPKKDGAGGHNWGNVEDESAQHIPTAQPAKQDVHVVDSSQFEQLKKAVKE